jgi:hypothetical protein
MFAALYFIVVLYVSTKGLGYLFGLGLTERNKCWQSEEYNRRKWKESGDRRYKEYFS